MANIYKKNLSAMLRYLLICTSCFVLLGCSIRLKSNESPVSTSDNGKWLKSGTLVIAREIPEQTSNSQGSLMGFMPQVQDKATNDYSLKIDTSNRTASIFHGSIKLEDFLLKDIEGLEPGEYTILHKQRHPVWYASDSYYINRGLALPDSDDPNRYLKGALGDFVIYLDEQTPIHNAQVWSDDVGGIRISDNNIAKMYYQLDIGSRVTIE